jgi:homocysteine S-methyltransferase
MTSSRQQELLERLHQGPVIIGDGAMGTQLYHRGAPLDAVFEYLNLIQPELVSRVHTDYAAAGAQLLETNTFGANALRLGSFGLAGKCREINLAGARLARAVAKANSWIAGSIGPLLPPRGSDVTLSTEKKQALFLEQMTALAEGGVDCFLLETFGQTGDLLIALNTAARIGLPAIAQLAFAEGGFTGDGLKAAEAARRLAAKAPAAIGVNCGAGPRELLEVLKSLASVTACPLSAFPNSGFPQYIDGRHIYLATPKYFASLGREMAEAGASLIGGCCGTTPQHIAALATTLAGKRPGPRRRRPPIPDSARPSSPSPPKRTSFLTDWGKRPIVTVELPPPRGLDISATLSRARTLAEAGVDAINLAENPLGRIRMGNLVLAGRIQDETRVAVIAHVTGRDRNLLGLHSELMGAHLLGLRNLLAVTGDPVAVSGETGATNVFDVNSVGLLKLMQAMNQGTNLFGADLEGRTEFLTGAAFNPNTPDLTGQITKLSKKIAAGARFIQTQPVYDVNVLERMAEVLRRFDLPVLVGIMPLISERNALFLHNEVPGINLPDRVLDRMRGHAGTDGVAAGMAIAGELLAKARHLGFCGYYLIPPFGRVDLAVALIQNIRQPSPPAHTGLAPVKGGLLP